ncbi:hypothetical protein BGZ46_010204 [Entomortierella lignicola]|nr:hypothetical protein BGZ46_010204 [Entomortierella lignicola]
MSGHGDQLPLRTQHLQRQQQQQQQRQQQQHLQRLRQGLHPLPLPGNGNNLVHPHSVQAYQNQPQASHQAQMQLDQSHQYSPYQMVQLPPPQALAAQFHPQQYSHPLQLSLPTTSLSDMSQQSMSSPHVSNIRQFQHFQQLREQPTLTRPNGNVAKSDIEANSSRARCHTPLEAPDSTVVSNIGRHIQQYMSHQSLQQPQRQTNNPQPVASSARSCNQLHPKTQLHSGPTPSSIYHYQAPVSIPSSSTVPASQMGHRLPQHSSSVPSSGRANPYPLRTRVQSRSVGTRNPTMDANSSMEDRPNRASLLTMENNLRQSRSPVVTSRTGLFQSPLSALSEYEASTNIVTIPTMPASTDDHIEVQLPPQAPISMHCPLADHLIDRDVEMTRMDEDDPIEVTLNIDIPKTSSPVDAGNPNVTVLSVNPSWHCVFVETVQQQRVRAWIRIQFCPSPLSSTYKDHQSKILKLRTVQVIGYASRQVELTRRIAGQNLLRKGGITVHLDPLAISFNDASYGFTLSFSSFMAERLCSSNVSRPDEPLPLSRQQNSAYCRRNLKELYYDTFSKDVAITLKPSDEVFHAHSVVLESHGYFRALLGRATRDSTGGIAEEMNENSMHSSSSGSNSQAVIDEEGHVPTEINSLLLENTQQRESNTATSSEGSSDASVIEQRSQSTIAEGSPPLTTSTSALPSATAPTTSTVAFSWRELYETSTRFQLSGLMHLCKLVLLSRLEADGAVKELFEWAYLHWNLVPCYVSFLIENIDPTLLGLGMQSESQTNSSSTTATVTKSALWYYHDKCPRFNDIMAMFLRILNERKEAKTLV